MKLPTKISTTALAAIWGNLLSRLKRIKLPSKSSTVVLAIALTLCLCFCLCICIGLRYLYDNKLPNFRQEADIYIYPKTELNEVIEMISKEAGVRRKGSLKRMFRKKQVAKYMQVGHYSIDPNHSSVYVARMLNNGWQSPITLTLAPGLRRKGDIARKLSSQLLVDSTTVRNSLDSDSLLSNYGFNAKTVYALLIPDNYQMYWTESVEDFLDRQKRAYDKFWTAENEAAAKKLGLSKIEVATLASIVNCETNFEKEMPLIAGVYLNRLKIGMKLQADPTVAFCFDYKLLRILSKHLKVDSPYNTYKHAGLPPGPICVPSRAALEAVLHPDYGGSPGKGNLYFCANSDFSGTHIFARSYAEHQRNAAAFRQEMNRRGIK